MDDRIVSDPNLLMGKPVVAGTRISVELILEAHPRWTRSGILAALEFASRALRADVLYPTQLESA